MIWQFIAHTPTWVFGLFVALAILGLRQYQTRQLHTVWLYLWPGVMVCLSYAGLVSSFGFVVALHMLWLAALVIFAAAVNAYTPMTGVEWKANRIQVPGSWVPLVLIMGLFALKYVVAALWVLQPQVARQPVFIMACTAVYGAFSGMFAGRALAIWRHAKAMQRQ